MCEKDWGDNSTSSPVAKSQHSTPTMPAAGPSYPHQPAAFGGQLRVGGTSGSVTAESHSGSSGDSTPHDQLVDLPNNLFYPFYPEDARNAPTAGGNDQGYSHLLAQAGAAHGHAGSYESYMSEERDTAHPHPAHTHAQAGGQGSMWVSVPSQPPAAQGARPPAAVYSPHT